MIDVNTSPPDEIEKNPFILMLCKGSNLCNPPSIHLKLEPSWDVKACIMPLADLYAVPKCDIRWDFVTMITVQYSIHNFCFCFTATREARTIYNEEKGST